MNNPLPTLFVIARPAAAAISCAFTRRSFSEGVIENPCISCVVIPDLIRDPCLPACHPAEPYRSLVRRREPVEGSTLPSHFSLLTSRSQQGFALLLTLVVVSVIGAVAFGIGRLTLTELRQTVRFQDSQSALQAAEAGIEDGLLRYRLEHDSQIPTKEQCGNPPGYTEPTSDVSVTNYVLRVNLTTSNSAERVKCVDLKNPLTPTPPKSDIVYDMKVYFKGKELGTCGDQKVTIDCGVQLNKDDDASIVVDKVPSVSIKAGLENADTQSTAGGLGFTHALEIKLFTDQGTQVGPPIFLDQSRDTFLKGKRGFPVTVPNGVSSIQIRPRDADTSIAAALPEGTPESINIDFGFEFIESTGYANGIKRKIQSIVNRSDDKARGVYDFVLFGGSSSVSAPSP